jgi:hypothetical protein
MLAYRPEAKEDIATGGWVESFAPTQKWESERTFRVVEDSDPATRGCRLGLLPLFNNAPVQPEGRTADR